MKRLFSDTESAFKFEFAEDESKDNGVESSAAPSLDSLFTVEDLAVAEKLSDGLPCVVAISEHSGVGVQLQVQPGELFLVDYSRSSPLEIHLSKFIGTIPPMENGSKRLKISEDQPTAKDVNSLVPRDVLLPLEAPSQALWHKSSSSNWIFPAPGPLLGVFDCVWADQKFGFPLAIEPGLSSFAWPLTSQQFRNTLVAPTLSTTTKYFFS